MYLEHKEQLCPFTCPHSFTVLINWLVSLFTNFKFLLKRLWLTSFSQFIDSSVSDTTLFLIFRKWACFLGQYNPEAHGRCWVSVLQLTICQLSAHLIIICLLNENLLVLTTIQVKILPWRFFFLLFFVFFCYIWFWLLEFDHYFFLQWYLL